MSELDSFLGKGGEEPPADAQQAPSYEAHRAEAEASPKANAQQQAEAPAPEQKDDDEPPAPAEGEPTVPRRAYEDERRKRQDHKERAARAEALKEELERQVTQLEERLKRAEDILTPRQQPTPWINPAEDPQGYHERVQQVVLNERLNSSEMLAREKHGDAEVDAAVAEFRTAMQADPSLQDKLYGQPHPYAWMMKEVQAQRLRREIGDDPAGYEAKLRQKWEAEMQAKAPTSPPPPAVNLPPSLANARSAAPRSAPAYSGPDSLEDILRRN